MIEAKLKRSFPARLIVLGLLSLGLGALLVYWISRSYVKQLDDSGVILRNGKRFFWRDLEEARPSYWVRHGSRRLNHVDLKFPTGTAGVYYQVFENGREVLDFVRRKTGQEIPLA